MTVVKTKVFTLEFKSKEGSESFANWVMNELKR